MVLATTVLIKFFFMKKLSMVQNICTLSIIRRGLQGTKLGTRPPNNINVVSYIHSQSRFPEQLINDFTKLTGEHILAPHFSCVSRCNTLDSHRLVHRGILNHVEFLTLGHFWQAGQQGKISLILLKYATFKYFYFHIF